MTALRDDYVTAIELENETLRERIANLEEFLGLRIEVPLAIGLTTQEAKLFGLLLKRDIVSKDMAMVALYGNKPDGDAAEEKIVDVFICKMRRKLKGFDIQIDTVWGRGYHMTVAAKARATALMLKQSSQAA